MKKTSMMMGLTMAATTGFCGLVADFNPQNLANAMMPARSATVNGTTETWDFSDSNPLFNGNAADGLKIYGGVQHFNSSAYVAGTLNVSSAFDRYQSQTGAAGVDTSILLWNKADFVSGSSSPLAFGNTADSQFGIVLSGVNVTLDGRFVIKDSGTYYLSDYAMTASGTFALSGTDNAQWATFNPGNFDFTPTSAFSAQTFTNVEAVGFAYSVSRSGITRIWVNDFNASLVPEPATLGLVAAAGASLLFIRRRLVL